MIKYLNLLKQKLRRAIPRDAMKAAQRDLFRTAATKSYMLLQHWTLQLQCIKILQIKRLC